MTEPLTLSLSQELKSEFIKFTFKVGGDSKKKKSCYNNSSITTRGGLPWWLSGKESACQQGFNLWSRKIPYTLEQLSQRATTIKPVLQSLEAAATEAHAPYSLCFATREVTALRNLCIKTGEYPLLAAARENPLSNEDPAQPKIK